MNWLDTIKWDAQGLVPVIAQEQGSKDVLMFAWMNREALQKTAELGRAVYFSRSRGKLWFKGEESGHVQTVHDIRLDCDNDVILLSVTQTGHDPSIACHTGRHSCFYQRWQASPDGGQWLSVEPVLQDPDTSYVARLLHKGPDAFLKKIGEEATEVVMAAKDLDHGGDPHKLVGEMADLWFHSLVALAHYGLTPEDVLQELSRREGLSGLEEKALRKAQAREAGED